MKTSEFVRLYPHRHLLGEGIFVDDRLVSWVDIEADELFVLQPDGDVDRHFLPAKPSVILHHAENALVIGCDTGLCEFDLAGHSLRQIAKFPAEFDVSSFRSNDGCRLQDGRYLLGSMHRERPEEFAGEIYLFDSNDYGTALEFPIHIPNGFVVLPASNVLVADSCSGVISLLEFDSSGRCVSVGEWNHDESISGTPDGACRLPDGSILFAFWGGNKLVRFASNGRVIGEIAVPVRKPSNCKYRDSDNRLYITSASAGLDIASNSKSDCGHTLSCAVDLDG